MADDDCSDDLHSFDGADQDAILSSQQGEPVTEEELVGTFTSGHDRIETKPRVRPEHSPDLTPKAKKRRLSANDLNG